MPGSHLPSPFVPPQHRRTSETSISPPGSSIGSPNRVICVSAALPLAQGPGDGNSSFQWAKPRIWGQHGHFPLPQQPPGPWHSSGALRGAQPCPPSSSALPLQPLRPLLSAVPAAGVTVGSVCPMLAPHCALQPPFPSLLLFLSSSLSLPLPLPRLKWIMRSLITKTWQLFPRLKPSMKCSVLTSFPTSPITDTRRMRRWRDIAMGRY